MNSTSFSGPATSRSLRSYIPQFGRGLSAVVIVLMLADGLVQLLAPTLLQEDMAAIAFPIAQSPTLGLITLTCVALYAIPRTAVVGAVLLTGFFGGAIALHFRIGEIGSPPQMICLLLGIASWAGLYLRDTRLRQLLG